jgi:hypothetical protein
MRTCAQRTHSAYTHHLRTSSICKSQLEFSIDRMPSRTVLLWALLFHCLDCGACSMMPKLSDVCFTSRFAHYGPEPGGLTTWEAAHAFHATRLDWVYTTNATFIAAAHKKGLKVTAAMSANLPDPGNSTSWQIGRMENIHGEKITAPWMRAWARTPNYGCINNPDYRKIAFDYASMLLTRGSDAIQHDDPATNGEAVNWNNGNTSTSGCYCSHCNAKFTSALLSNLNQSQIKELNITTSFDYKQTLLSSPSTSSKRLVELRKLFVQFQKNSTESYVLDLRAHVGPNVTMSSNNGDGEWTTPFHLFDYGESTMH